MNTITFDNIFEAGTDTKEEGAEALSLTQLKMSDFKNGYKKFLNCSVNDVLVSNGFLLSASI